MIQEKKILIVICELSIGEKTNSIIDFYQKILKLWQSKSHKTLNQTLLRKRWQMDSTQS